MPALKPSRRNLGAMEAISVAEKYTIYGLVDPTDGQLRYVGKTEGRLNVRVAHHVWRAKNQDTNTHKRNWIRKLDRSGVRPQIVALWRTDDVEILSAAEQFWISYFKTLGCKLTNATEGGEGASGYRHTAEARARMSVSKKGYRTEAHMLAYVALRRLSPEQEQRVCDLYLSGLSLGAVAEAMSVEKKITDSGIRKVLLRNKISLRLPWAVGPKRGVAPKLGPEAAKKVVERYLAGENARSIAKIFDVSDTAVLRTLHRVGVKIRSRRGASGAT